MIYKLNTVDSTQKYITKNITKFKLNDAVYSLKQTAGYGRTGSWESNEENIYFSLLTTPCPYAWLYTICAMHKFCTKYNKDIYIKIPNDLYYQNNKLAGFIIEPYNGNIIIGIGINVFLQNNPNFTSLSKLTNKELNIDHLVEKLYITLLNTFNEDITFLNTYFANHTNMLNQNINFYHKKNNTKLNGIVKKINFDTITIDNKTYNIEEITITVK